MPRQQQSHPTRCGQWHETIMARPQLLLPCQQDSHVFFQDHWQRRNEIYQSDFSKSDTPHGIWKKFEPIKAGGNIAPPMCPYHLLT